MKTSLLQVQRPPNKQRTLIKKMINSNINKWFWCWMLKTRWETGILGMNGWNKKKQHSKDVTEQGAKDRELWRSKIWLYRWGQKLLENPCECGTEPPDYIRHGDSFIIPFFPSKVKIFVFGLLISKWYLLICFWIYHWRPTSHTYMKSRRQRWVGKCRKKERKKNVKR